MTLATSLAAQITALDTQLATLTPVAMASDSTSVTYMDWVRLSKRRVELEALYNRATGASPMVVRGRLTGLSEHPNA